MSSVSLGWGLRNMGREGWGKVKAYLQPRLLDPLVSFSQKMVEGLGGTAGRELSDASPNEQGLVLLGLGHCQRLPKGQYWAMGPTGPSCGLHSWLKGRKRRS